MQSKTCHKAGLFLLQKTRKEVRAMPPIVYISDIIAAFEESRNNDR